MKLRGYKVMRIDGDRAVSGADSRQSFPLKEGHVVRMPENGIYVGSSKEYVLDYYSGLADEEVLLTFEFDSEDILSGDPRDREPELGVSQATLVEWEEL